MQHYTVRPGGTLSGRVQIPGDKSVSHRALLLGAIAEGESEVRGLLRSEDCLATLAGVRALGVRADDDGRRVRIHGTGLHGLQAPPAPLDLGNSGTAIRLLAGLLAGQRFDSELTGDSSLRRRPMRRVAEPLQRMGARVDTTDGCPPLRISGGQRLHGIDYRMPVASAQVKSALLLAGLYADSPTRVDGTEGTRDHTETMLAAMGANLRTDDDGVHLTPGVPLQAVHLTVPGDLSSAAFFLLGGLIAARDELVLENVGVNPTRTGVLAILEQMGARIELLNPRLEGREPVADLRVRKSELHGIDVPPRLVPLAIDEFPVLFVAAALARGTTKIEGAEELRHKESDRIALMVQGLRALGVRVQERPDGAVIEGGGGLTGGEIESGGDHRVAMTFAMAALAADGPVRVRDTENVATSFPDFPTAAAAAGLELVVSRA